MIEIIGNVEKNRLYCAGSLTKLLTTYVCLSLLSEKFILKNSLDDDNFFERIASNQAAKQFLTLFQAHLGAAFSLHDICSYYAGLPYTFDLAPSELIAVESNHPFKHHRILDETDFLERCKTCITPVYAPRSKFHYSELSIIFLGYLLEKSYSITMEELYHTYIFDAFNLKNSCFSRYRVPNVYIQDLSDRYDYPSIAILDHGFFCYSNGFYTTLNDMKILLENLLEQPLFHYMTDITHARAASNRLMNGLTVELRQFEDDLIYGYEGLSFSGCNLWAYSTKHKKGYLTFSNDEEKIYEDVYGQWGYHDFSTVPRYTQEIYQQFLTRYSPSTEKKAISERFQGAYHRVNINEKTLLHTFSVGENFIIIRNPDEIQYDLVYRNGEYRVKGRDGVHGARVGFYRAKSGNHYMLYDGTLYKKR